MTEDALAQARQLKAEREQREAIDRITGQLHGISEQLEDVRLDLQEVDPRASESVFLVRDTIREIIDRLRRRR